MMKQVQATTQAWVDVDALAMEWLIEKAGGWYVGESERYRKKGAPCLCLDDVSRHNGDPFRAREVNLGTAGFETIEAAARLVALLERTNERCGTSPGTGSLASSARSAKTAKRTRRS